MILTVAKKIAALVHTIFYITVENPLITIKNAILSLWRSTMSALRTTVKVGVITTIVFSLIGMVLLAVASSMLFNVSHEVVGYFYSHLIAAVYTLITTTLWTFCAATVLYLVTRL